MKKVMVAFVAFFAALTLIACSKSNIEGTWYSVEDGTMYNFNGGQITDAGEIVGQYDEEDGRVIISWVEDEGNQKLFVANINDMEVLSNTADDTGRIYFCKGIDNAERIMQERENALQDFYETHSDGFMSEVTGVWDTLDGDAEYKSIDVNMYLHHVDFYYSDASSKKGTYVPDNLEKEANGTVRYRLEMVDRGYDSPTVFYYIEGHAYVLEIYIDKSNVSNGELVLVLHTAADAVIYTKAEN